MLCQACDHHQSVVGTIYCHNCAEAICRLQGMLKSRHGRTFVQRLLLDAFKHAEFDERAFPEPRKEVRHA